MAAGLQRLTPGCPVAPSGQRAVEVEAFASAGAHFVSSTDEVGIVFGRVGVHGTHEHIGTFVENLLGAVAVVVVHVQYRHAAHTAVDEGLRRNRRIVQVAIPCQACRACVVAGRAAQGERRPSTFGHCALRRQRHLSGLIGCCPRASHQGRDGITGKPAELGHDGVRAARRHAAGRTALHRPELRQRQFRTTVVRPAFPGRLQEVQVVGSVHPCDGCQAGIAGQPQLVCPWGAQGIQHHIDAIGQVEVRRMTCACHGRAGVVQAVGVAMDDEHERGLRGAQAACRRCAAWRAAMWPKIIAGPRVMPAPG